MERTGIRAEERTGLILAVALHLLLLAVLVIQALMPAPPIEKAERMTVSLTEDVGLEATAPDPVAESRAAIAPELADLPAPVPEILEAPTTPQVERPKPRVAAAAPAPTRKSRPTPRREQPRQKQQAQPKPVKKSGGSRVGDNFLAGAGDSVDTNEARVPAATFGNSEKTALTSAITRALRPHWSVPSGVDTELLVSVVAWRLNSDGSLKGRPRLISQRGINASNKAQAALHAERAIRAVQLAAPFKLDSRFYNQWDELEWEFDRRL